MPDLSVPRLFLRLFPVFLIAITGASCGGSGSSTGGSTKANDSAEQTEAAGSASSAETSGEDEGTSSSEVGGDAESSGSDDDAAQWTVLVYVMGDNDLEPFAVDDIFEMAEAGSNEHLNIVTLIDRHPGYSDGEVGPLGDFAGTQLVHVGQDEILDAIDLGEVNTGSSDELAAFVSTGVTKFPAERYALVLWDHGAGWPGMGPDETDGDDILTLPEISSGISRGLQESGLERLDLIGFDACLMGGLEVANQVESLADVMVASEELEPGHGWDFSSLEVLRGGDDVSSIELATAIIDSYQAQAIAFETSVDITLSAIDLAAIGSLDDALHELASVIETADGPVIGAVGAARERALAFGDSPDPTLATHAVDLGSLMNELLLSGAPIRPEVENVLGALDAAVLHEVSGVATARATGLSVYFPPTWGYLDLEYIDLATLRMEETGEPSGWARVLTGYLDAGLGLSNTQSSPVFDETVGIEYLFDEDGINVLGTVIEGAPDSIVSAEITYAVIDESDDSLIFIGEEPAEYISFGDGTGEVVAIYDLTVLTLSDGIDTDYAYLDMEMDLDAEFWYLDVPLWYIPPEEFDTDDEPHDVTLSLTLDWDGNIVSEIYYEFGADGMVGELIADPEGLIFPTVYNLYADAPSEWVTLSEVGLFADLPNLMYDLEALESGTDLYVELRVTDYAGNVASEGGFVTVP